jgi:hypothetical protein
LHRVAWSVSRSGASGRKGNICEPRTDIPPLWAQRHARNRRGRDRCIHAGSRSRGRCIEWSNALACASMSATMVDTSDEQVKGFLAQYASGCRNFEGLDLSGACLNAAKLLLAILTNARLATLGLPRLGSTPSTDLTEKSRKPFCAVAGCRTNSSHSPVPWWARRSISIPASSATRPRIRNSQSDSAPTCRARTSGGGLRPRMCSRREAEAGEDALVFSRSTHRAGLIRDDIFSQRSLSARFIFSQPRR